MMIAVLNTTRTAIDNVKCYQVIYVNILTVKTLLLKHVVAKQTISSFSVMKFKMLKMINKKAMLKNTLTVESPCGIEPQSLTNENLTIRL